jgi:competence protein ComEA
MLEYISNLVDRLNRLPYWQVGLLILLLICIVAGGYIMLKPPPRPTPDFVPNEETAAREPQQLTVHVAGAVKNPGVVRIEEGKRVIDAIEQAGGPLPEADLDALNLAQQVQDGQRINVPRQGEATVGAGTGATGNESGHKVNINLASARELEELPGIGPTLAERIVAYREKKGGFKKVDELKQVSGIGEKKFEELRDYVEI